MQEPHIFGGSGSLFFLERLRLLVFFSHGSCYKGQKPCPEKKTITFNQFFLVTLWRSVLDVITLWNGNWSNNESLTANQDILLSNQSSGFYDMYILYRNSRAVPGILWGGGGKEVRLLMYFFLNKGSNNFIISLYVIAFVGGRSSIFIKSQYNWDDIEIKHIYFVLFT